MAPAKSVPEDVAGHELARHDDGAQSIECEFCCAISEMWMAMEHFLSRAIDCGHG